MTSRADAYLDHLRATMPRDNRGRAWAYSVNNKPTARSPEQIALPWQLVEVSHEPCVNQHVGGREIRAARVAHYARAVARQLGLPRETRDRVAIAALFHDIGKQRISRLLLDKPGPLTAEEFAVVKAHTWLGSQLLRSSSAEVLQDAAQVALLHHEKYDGTGYPFGLRGERIPLPARIVAVADVFDALRSRRAYKVAWPTERAFEYLYAEQGRHFDPECVQAFFTSSVWVDRDVNVPRFVPPIPARQQAKQMHMRSGVYTSLTVLAAA